MDNQQQVFNELVSKYSEKLYWHVRSIVGTHEDADDLMQDIYIKVWESLPTFRGDSQIFTWLWRIATNECLSFLRKRKVRAALSFLSISKEAEEIVGSDPYFNGDKAQRALATAIQKLPAKQRQVFCMRYFEELSYEELSEITGTSVGALKASYHFAVDKISQEVGGEF